MPIVLRVMRSCVEKTSQKRDKYCNHNRSTIEVEPLLDLLRESFGNRVHNAQSFRLRQRRQKQRIQRLAFGTLELDVAVNKLSESPAQITRDCLAGLVVCSRFQGQRT